MTINEKLFSRLAQNSDLPSPPGIALKLIGLVNDPDSSVSDLVELIKNDPALSTRVLKTVNSPLFCLQRSVTTLNHAIALLGFHAVQTIALSFTLARNLIDMDKTDTDLTWFWRKSVFAATAAQELGNRRGMHGAEALFMGSLLQDIGVLVLSQFLKDAYRPLLKTAQQSHEDLTGLEQSVLGTDHTEIGAWLFKEWNFPELLQEMIRNSHYRGKGEVSNPEVSACVSLSGLLAEIWLNPEQQDLSEKSRTLTEGLFEFDEMKEVLTTVDLKLPAVFQLFDIKVQTEEEREAILAKARETLAISSVSRDVEIRSRVNHMESELEDLRKKALIDPLTGLYNRSHFKKSLDDVFDLVMKEGCAIAVVVFDIDHFKHFNDRYGHATGDLILKEVAYILSAQIRESDIVRFGGEEFVLVLRNITREHTDSICNRLREKVAEHRIRLATGESVGVTVSVGYVHFHGQSDFKESFDLFEAADRAMYAAKQAGRNLVVPYEKIREDIQYMQSGDSIWDAAR